MTDRLHSCKQSPTGRHWWCPNGDYDDICNYCGRHSIDLEPREWRDMILRSHAIPVRGAHWKQPIAEGKPYSVTITIEGWVFTSLTFPLVLRYEMDAVRDLIVAERRRRLTALGPIIDVVERERFCQDLGRPADGHLGAVGGE